MNAGMGKERLLPFRKVVWMRRQLVYTETDDDRIQKEVNADQHYRDSDCFFETTQKNYAEDGDECEGYPNLVPQYLRSEWVLDDVRGRIGSRKRDGDDEIRCHEPEQDEHKELSFPARELVLKHRNRAFTVRTLFSDAVINRQRAEQRQQYEDDRCDWRKCLCGEKSNAGLITESREIVDSGQTHHLPPGMLFMRSSVSGVLLSGAFE